MISSVASMTACFCAASKVKLPVSPVAARTEGVMSASTEANAPLTARRNCEDAAEGTVKSTTF